MGVTINNWGHIITFWGRGFIGGDYHYLGARLLATYLGLDSFDDLHDDDDDSDEVNIAMTLINNDDPYIQVKGGDRYQATSIRDGTRLMITMMMIVMKSI